MTNRDAPDFDALRAIDDPEEFVWAILPHAARSFATSILVLPRREAWAAAIAYLQCRILDTYEDLLPDVAARPGTLRAVGSRWRYPDPGPAPPIASDLAISQRDQVHLLLVERVNLIDRAYAALSVGEKSSISELVGNMAEGMAWAAETFAEQDGLLLDRSQRSTYCHYVIGEPALYAMRSLLHLPTTERHRHDALAVAEMIQLANITRDIEKDLARNVGYDAALAPALGSRTLDVEARRTVAAVRTRLMGEAVEGVAGYARLVSAMPRGISQARGAAAIMLGFTDRYYAGCARLAGHPGWRRRPRALIYLDGILASMWSKWADRVVTRTKANFDGFTESLAS